VSKYILGISAYYHDSGAAIIKDGEIIAAVQEERFTRVKGDSSFPVRSIEYVLKASNIAPEELDAVAYYENPYLKFDRQLSTFLYGNINIIKNFIYTMKINIAEKIWVERKIKKFLKTEKIILTDHHLSHASSAFFPSPFEESTILTIDGVGEWSTASIGYGDKNKISISKHIEYPNSLGLLYSAFTVYTGFKVNSGEYKLMGLAPFGDPVYYDLIINNIVKINIDGSIVINPIYFDYFNGRKTINKKFEELFKRKTRYEGDPLEKFHADIASSIQKVTTEIILKMAKFAKEIYPSDNLVLAGGVALNVVSIGELERSNIFKNIWVQPASGDAGGSLGAALYVHYHENNNIRNVDNNDSMKGAFLGPNPSDIGEDIESLFTKYKIKAYKLEDVELIKKIAQALADKQVVAIAKGRMEFGPRALGSRSVLADARDDNMQSRLNLKTKYREGFRPFAPMIKAEAGKDYFDNFTESPYMLKTFYLKNNYRMKLENSNKEDIFKRVREIRSIVPAVTHIDYSARAQSVDRKRNPFIYSIIENFEKITGTPIVINTSFNVRGEPIVASSEDAIECFLNTDIDILVLENYIINKKENDGVKSKRKSAIKND